MQTSQEKTSAEYWTTFWNNYTLPKPIQINTRTLSSYVYRIYDQHFKKAFAGQETRGKKILELGCGNSVFLSYFNQEFGFEVYGIDYTEIGCEQTRAILDRDRVKGTIILGDIFNP